MHRRPEDSGTSRTYNRWLFIGDLCWLVGPARSLDVKCVAKTGEEIYEPRAAMCAIRTRTFTGCVRIEGLPILGAFWPVSVRIFLCQPVATIWSISRPLWTFHTTTDALEHFSKTKYQFPCEYWPSWHRFIDVILQS